MVNGTAVEGSPYLPPLGTEQEFAELVAQLVADEAPRLFALVEEHGERADGWIVAWGVALVDSVTVCGADGRIIGTFGSAQGAYALLSRRRTLRLQWVEGPTTEPSTCSSRLPHRIPSHERPAP